MHSNLSHDEHERLRGFAEWTLNVGNGSIQGYSLLRGSEPDWIEIPDEFLINSDNNGLKNLIEFVYPNLNMIHIFEIVVFWDPLTVMWMN